MDRSAMNQTRLKNPVLLVSLGALGILMGLTEPVWGEIYQFVDVNGVVYFTNVPTDPRYRRLQSKGAVIQPPIQSRLQETHQIILSTSQRYRVDPALVKAVIKVESDFDSQAVSGAGAMGLMQLMPATASDLGVQNPFNPFENISGGVRHLSQLLDRFNGDLVLTLAAYHAGARRVEQYQKVPPIEKTHHYIRKVMTAYKTYREADLPRKSTYKVSSSTGHVIYTNVPEPYQGGLRYEVAYAK